MSETQEEKSETVDPFVEIDFGPQIGTRRFFSADELVTFSTRLVDLFSWMTKARQASSAQHHVFNTVWGPIEALQAVALNARSAANENLGPDLRSAKEQLVAIGRGFAERRLMGPDDPRALWLRRMSETDTSGALLVLGALTGHLVNVATADEVAAIVRAMSFELGAAESASATAEVLREQLNSWSRQQSEMSAQLVSAQRLLEEIREQRASELRAHSEAFDTDQAKRTEGFASQLRSNTSDLDAFKKAYNEELATRSAVKYWADKAVIHRWLAVLTAGVAIGGGSFYFGVVVPTSFANLLAHFAVGADQMEWRAGILLGLILLGVWLGRIVVRLFLSQLHLAADASHRRVALMSYVALLKNETSAVTANDRSLVLGTVFRPISDGLIRDDAMPPSAWEVLTRTPK